MAESSVDEARRIVVATGATVVSEALGALDALAGSDAFTGDELARLDLGCGHLRLLLASLEARRGLAVQFAGGAS